MRFVLFLPLALFLSCSHPGNEKSKRVLRNEQDSSITDCKNPGTNPNGSSELALLMRLMQKHANEAKVSVERNSEMGDMPDFNKIFTAIPTDAEIKKVSFTGFAQNYLNALKEFHSSDKEQRRSRYNALIGACESCHNDHCPGPLTVIRKLKIPN
jgi:hypothetical protein